MEQSTNRASRTSESRAATKRPSRWAPSQLLPEVHSEEGYAFRWIRMSTLNTDDPLNRATAISKDESIRWSV